MALIKDYIKRRYQSNSTVKLERGAIIVSVPSPALAATIHLERQRLVDSCRIKKRLFIRARR
jgi:hypothetical protein